MKFPSSLLAMFALAACDQAAWPVQNGVDVESRINVERLISEERGLTDDCIAKLRAGGLAAMPERVDQCFKMTQPQHWRGLWRAEFEGSEFCPEPARVCEHSPARKGVWLEGFSDVQRDGAIYRVEFIGRRTVYPGLHGHMGMSAHEMIVDRPISIAKVEE